MTEATQAGSDRPRIVVGYSSRPEGRAALRRALAEATLRDAELVVLHGPEDDLDELAADLAAARVRHELKAMQDANDAGEDLVELAEETGAATRAFVRAKTSALQARRRGARAGAMTSEVAMIATLAGVAAGLGYLVWNRGGFGGSRSGRPSGSPGAGT